MVLRPELTSEDGAAFLHTAMTRRFIGPVQIVQTDGGPEFTGAFAQLAPPYVRAIGLLAPIRNTNRRISSFNRTLWKEYLGWNTYRVEELPALCVEVRVFLDRYHYQRSHLGLTPTLARIRSYRKDCRIFTENRAGDDPSLLG